MSGFEWIDTAAASETFQSLPAGLRLVSLSPAFAAADATREDSLTCLHARYREAGAVWLLSTHVRPLAGDRHAFGAVAPYGYGGPLSSSDDAAFVSRAWAAWSQACRARHILAEFCRFHPAARNERFFGGSVAFNRDTVEVDLGAADPSAGYSTLARRKLKRAQAQGFAARWTRDAADWARWAPFYRDAMRALGAAGWYLFADRYFDAMSALSQAWLCVCERDGQWGSAGLYLFGPEVLEYHLGASSADGLSAGTAVLLQHAAALRGIETGARALYLGGGTDPRPDNPLLFYKAGFSPRRLPFHVGQAVHDEQAYWALAQASGYTRDRPPARILLD